MSEQKDGIGSGILRGLKKILFTDAPAETSTLPAIPVAPLSTSNAHIVAETKPAAFTTDPTDNGKEMKLRIYQLLESINQQGVDFFEVWNASVEMGGATATNIRAAFTSLKYVDKSLTKDKLLQTGQYYIDNLVKVLDTEATKRKEEKNKLLSQKEEQKKNLTIEIAGLEKQLTELQQKLTNKKNENNGINEKYQPLIEAIDQKIVNGQQAVNSVVSEMQEVVSIIQKDIN